MITEEDISLILNMLDVIEDEWGLSSLELELREKLEKLERGDK